MTAPLSFQVQGVPVPQGSMKHVGGGRIVASNAKSLAAWRADIGEQATRARTHTEWNPDGPMLVSIMFELPRPASAPKRVTMPAKRPDVDKLARAVLDALTDVGVWHDDGQVIDLVARKRFGLFPATTITVEPAP